MLSVRLYFEKTGSAVYISHLDLLRCFERCMRRADVPFWFTEGFNPRPFMSFALPLSLGVTGLREVVDIRLTEDMPFDEVISRLNGVLPEGLRILSAVTPKKKVTDIASSKYSIRLAGCADLCESLSRFLEQESIVTQKLNKKKKLADIDIKPYIKSFSVSSEDADAVLEITLASGTSENCNPTLVLSAFCGFAGRDELPQSITREMILDSSGKEFA